MEMVLTFNHLIHFHLPKGALMINRKNKNAHYNQVMET